MRLAPGFDGSEAVGHAHGQVVVAVKAQLGLGLQGLAHGGEFVRLTLSGSMWPAESVT